MSGVPTNDDGPVYVGLGANVGDPERTLSAAAEAIARLPDVELRRRSSLYAAAPIGPPQPEFRNAVVSLVTRRSPETLLAALLDIERAHGRVRSERWGPRVLDLDILLWEIGWWTSRASMFRTPSSTAAASRSSPWRSWTRRPAIPSSRKRSPSCSPP